MVIAGGMADIAPLTPLRYDLARLGGTLARVVAPPYDVIDAAQRAELAARDPHNVVRLELPEGEGDAKYENAGALLGTWRREGVLIRDEEPAFYRYEQRFVPPGAGPGAKKITRRGFFAAVRAVPFSAKVVLPHERTLSGPKEDRLKLFRATRASVSPGFMLYRDAERALDAALDRAETLTDFATGDGVEHALAKVKDPAAVRAIVEGIARSTLLIADGHHRYETSLRYAEEAVAASPNLPANAEPRFFMAFLANGDDPDLVVFPTHRHVHALPSFAWGDLLARAAALFDVKPLARGSDAGAILAALQGAGKGAPSLAACAPNGDVVVLSLRADASLAAHRTLGAQPEVLRRTDVALLHAGLLEDVLGITPEAQAAKTNLWYPQDAAGALADLRGGRGNVLFLMNATPVAQVRAVAEAGHVMPQKSTFFYPKVWTGLVLHTLEAARRVAL
jgi:uncharacterized protein (DUF1015 family)